MNVGQIALVGTVVTCLTAGAALAGTVDGTIIGVYSNVITSGYVANSPSYGQSTYSNNNSTAVYSITNSTDPSTSGSPPQQSTGSQLTSGDSNGGSGQPSVLNFFGATIPADYGSTFRIGTFTFINGTSGTGTVIFGATLSFYANSVSAANFLGANTVYITTTMNSGILLQDDDYLNICGGQSNICNKSIEATESSEGGRGLTFSIYGTIVGDQQLYIDQVAVADGQNPVVNGYIGSDSAVTLLPEPGAVLLLGPALALLATASRRRS